MIRLTREVRFSVDRDWSERISLARPITNAWAGWPSAVGITPYLTLRATLSGEPDAQTGYLCNIREIDRLLRAHAIPLIARRLQESGWRVAAETLLIEIWRGLGEGLPADARLAQLELAVTPYLRYALDAEDATMVRMTQQFEFSAAHRLHCPELSDEDNRSLFGKCNNPSGHGHNYVVDVTIGGDAGEPGGVLLPLPRFEAIVQERVIDRLDHKHLNVDTPYFRDLNPSVENIARVVFDLLDGHLAPARLISVRVYETPKTWADYVRG
ncbi:MAG: hypothetical protein D6744_18675 [Planctomycetota bacterium]|nr:MAG: hypothetical protein D6744_18675 [Planctomycetota bacterium]